MSKGDSMKRHLTLLWAVLLGVSMMGLPACGGSGKTEGAAPAEVEEAKVDPAEKFVGEWKMAAMQFQGMTVVGEFSKILDTDATMNLTLSEDGTGSMTMNEDEASLTWELVDDETAALTVVREESGDEGSDDLESVVSEDDTLNITYQDDGLLLELKDEETEGSVLFTTDGTAPAYPVLSIDDATAITSADDLVGEWKLTGMNFFGATMYGEAETLAEMVGDSADTTLVISEDGNAKIMGEDVTWSVGEEGATIDFGGTEVSLVSLGEGVAIDFNEVIGMDMVLLFTK